MFRYSVESAASIKAPMSAASYSLITAQQEGYSVVIGFSSLSTFLFRRVTSGALANDLVLVRGNGALMHISY